MIFDFDLRTEIRAQSHTFRLHAQCHSQAKRIALIGASGAGKSLTLQLLAGLMRPQSGSLKIENCCYIDTERGICLSPQQRHVGVVFQDYALFPHLTVAQNIAFGLNRSLFNPPRTPDAATQYWLDKMQLAALAHHYPHQLSGGQRQRTALARACIVKPRWLLLDEPFSALDTELRQHLRDTVAQVQQELNIPMLLVTHDTADCDSLADEIWRVDNGEIFKT